MSLSIQNISMKFDDVTALEDVSVEIRDGEFIAILGPSGCGKTTLLRVIGGFIQPTAGNIKLGDELYSSENFCVPVEKRNLGMVFQSFALWPHMSVREHIEFPLNSKRNRGMSPERKRAAVEEVISCTGLADLAERLPGELSGGQRQRVALARAIVSRPAILLMDEPLSALDAELRVSMRKEIQDIHRLTGATIIYVTHDQSEALAMANRMIIMKDGRIEQTGTPEEIYLYPRTEFVAAFVSKCNFVKGVWHGDTFKVQNSDVIYTGKNMGKCFIEKNIYPVRPEEFAISPSGAGIRGIVTNRQYSGRESHYTVKSGEEVFTVYERDNVGYGPEDEVVLIKKERIS